MSVKAHGVHNALPNADSFRLNLDIGFKSAAYGSVRTIGNGQGIIDDTADQVLPFPVEIKIEFGDGLCKSSDPGIKALHIFQQVRCQDDPPGDVKADHMNSLPQSVRLFIDNSGSIRITPVIVFRDR